MSSLATIDARMAAAVAALDDGDFATALRHARAAQGLLAVSPSRKHGDDAIEWNSRQDQIAAFIAGIRQDHAAALASSPTTRRRSNVVYTNPDSVDGGW